MVSDERLTIIVGAIKLSDMNLSVSLGADELHAICAELLARRKECDSARLIMEGPVDTKIQAIEEWKLARLATDEVCK